MWRNEVTHEPRESESDPTLDVKTEGPSLAGLGQAAGRTAYRWARENGWKVTGRRFSSISATPGFTAQVHSRYTVRIVQ